MTWATLLDLLAYEFARLRKVHVVNFGFASQPIFDPQQLKEEELTCAARVDSLVKDFARTRRWPALDDKEKYFLRERLRFAYDYATIASLGAKDPERLSTRRHVVRLERRFLEWLMIDVWRRSGVIVWIDPLLVLAETQMIKAPAWQREFAE